MYAQNQQYQQSLQTRLFGNDTIGKVTGYLKSHLSPKPSLKARLRGKAKSLEDFIAECKRREIYKAAVMHEEVQMPLYERTIDGRKEYRSERRFLVTAKSQGRRITFSEQVHHYTYGEGWNKWAGDYVSWGGVGSRYDPKNDMDKVEKKWKEELSNQGIEIISEWDLGFK